MLQTTASIVFKLPDVMCRCYLAPQSLRLHVSIISFRPGFDGVNFRSSNVRAATATTCKYSLETWFIEVVLFHVNERPQHTI